MANRDLFTKGVLIGVLVGLLGWSFFAFLNEGIVRFLVMVGDKTGFAVFFDTLFQNFIIFLILLIVIVLILGAAIGLKRVKQAISG